jgi:hypothetical protein
MMTQSCPVIVIEGACANGVIHGKHVHHRNFPEIWAEASSVAEGLAILMNHLLHACEGIDCGWQAELIKAAKADVVEYHERLIEG